MRTPEFELFNKLKSGSFEKMPELWDEINKLQIENKNPEYIKKDQKNAMKKYQLSPEGIKSVHDFRVEKAPQLNIEYSTNYSYLK